MNTEPKSPEKEVSHLPVAENVAGASVPPMPPEFGGREGPEATRFGDWELKGKCVDF